MGRCVVEPRTRPGPACQRLESSTNLARNPAKGGNCQGKGRMTSDAASKNLTKSRDCPKAIACGCPAQRPPAGGLSTPRKFHFHVHHYKWFQMIGLKCV